MKENTKPELNIDDVCQMIIDGKSYREIALYYQLSLGGLHKQLSLPVNSPRVRHALEMSASTFAEKALEALHNAERTMPGVTLAREEAQYWKWYAAKRNPRLFGDHSSVDVTQTTRKIVLKEQPVIDVQGTIVTPEQLPPASHVTDVPWEVDSQKDPVSVPKSIPNTKNENE